MLIMADPTIVLVHGAFTDASSWRRLHAELAVAFAEKAPAPAWRIRPSWAVLPAADGAIHPDVHRFSYDRMGAAVTVVEGASHAVMLSRPAVVAEVVRQAVRGCASGGRHG